jgi:hypothetical protein
LKAQNHHEDSQRLLCDAEILTTAIVAGLYFSGNYVKSMEFLADHNYIGHQMSRGRFSVRLNDVAHYLLTIFQHLGEYWKAENEEQIYLVDSYPIAACDNIRIPRAKIYTAAQYRGYTASKRRYFYGLKIHILVTKEGHPVEFFLTPGSFDDTSSLYSFHFDVPEGALIVGDKAYNLYQVEDDLDALGIQLRPLRKKNLTRQEPGYFQYLQHLYRKMVETAGSLIQRLLPKSIHATNARGFEIKVVLFILASSINALPLV